MRVKTAVTLLIVFVVFSSGCIKTTQQEIRLPEYVTPCNVIGENILVDAVGDTLSPSIVSTPLAKAFVDDIMDPRTNAQSTYSLDCWWGKNVGETSDLYYCTGSYTSPELSSDNIIKRYIKKDFKIGFNVEKRPGSSWSVDGVSYSEPTSFYLTVKSVQATCSVA
ncbi:MAG: hypothetical protein ABH834_00430 [Candidatus Altiarchaeota archaeon]